jgi:hypothetical protein
MAYKVGTTIVIDDSGNVDWSRIANKPAIGTGDVTGVTVVNGTPTSGATGSSTGAVYGTGTINTNFNGTTTYNCYVESLSGGGTTGAVTITANRKTFNCNCACRC